MKKKGNVRVKGLEPSRLSSPDPKSGAAANYATPACVDLKPSAKIRRFSLPTNCFCILLAFQECAGRFYHGVYALMEVVFLHIHAFV